MVSASRTREQYIDPEIDRTLDELASLIPAVTAREVMVRSRLVALAQRAYQHGESAALLSLMTGPQVAAHLGISESHTRHLSRQHSIGWDTGAGHRIYRPGDVDQLRAIRAERGRQRTN